jgi:hypothetical protein
MSAATLALISRSVRLARAGVSATIAGALRAASWAIERSRNARASINKARIAGTLPNGIRRGYWTRSVTHQPAAPPVRSGVTLRL